MNNMIKKKKKKGFTLIELIAVIAILAILGAIIVPRVTGYGAKAQASKDLANAKAILQAVEMYNVDHQDYQIGPTTGVDNVKTSAISSTTEAAGATPAGGLGKYLSWPSDPKTNVTSPAFTAKAWTSMTYTELQTYAQDLDKQVNPPAAAAASS
jgi:prepilin-type N-terminal cleavage/methylation domain-containing protein